MRHVRSGVVNWLLVGVISGWGVGLQLLRGDERQEVETGRKLSVTSGRCVGLEQTSLNQEAERKVQEQLSEQLAHIAEGLCGRRLSPRQLAQEQVWLLQQPGVVPRVTQKEEEKTYGLIVERTIELYLTPQVLAAWSERLNQQRQGRQRLWIATFGTTPLVWLMGWVGVVMLDRLTGGYHRRVLAWTALLLLGLGTAIGWAWVFWVL